MASGPRPEDLAGFLAEITRQLVERGLPFMLIGGQAVLLHGRPRVTEDIDVMLGVDQSRLADVRAVCDALRLDPLPADLEAFVRQTFVLPARHRDTTLRVDFVFSSTPYERQAIERAVQVSLAGVPVPFASAEDLILHKLFAGRALDWEDALSVARRKARSLDWPYIERWAGEFASVPGREDLPRRVTHLRSEAGP